MKRIHLYRGKRLDNGQFIEGSLTVDCHGNCCIYHPLNVPIGGGFQYFDIDPETVGQFTGETDSNGSLIFDGHIFSDDTGIKYIVFWDDKGQWCASDEFGETELLSDIITDTTNIIGNIHDNKELLK